MNIEANPEPSVLPRHIAIIMDGNGRWAKKQGKIRTFGHKAGVGALRKIVRECGDLGIEALTVFAFSSENWERPKTEVNVLMELFATSLEKEIGKLHEEGVRIQFIGNRSAFSGRLQKKIAAAEAMTAANTKMRFVIAANYGGRWDIINAAQQLAKAVENGELTVDQINEERFAAQTSLTGLPSPDLFIRTGGEQRISNYLLWDLAYTELYFTDVLWPDFDVPVLHESLNWFARRQRRFGKTGEQVEKGALA